jgi:hypothetical protein
VQLRAAALAALALLAGCGGCDALPDQAVTDCQQGVVLPGPVLTDILFVVDDSGSMAAEQQRLASAFAAFIARLAQSPIANDYQIGVTTTSVDLPLCDLDRQGTCRPTWTLQTAYPGGAPYPAGALVSAGGAPRLLRAGAPGLAADFAANVAVGTAGAGKEQGLRALHLALSERLADGANAGLLRPGARLLVVLVTDEDDCSDSGTDPKIVYHPSADRCHSDADQALLPPVQETVDFLRGPLAGEQRQLAVAVLAGVDPVSHQPADPACNPVGYRANRYRALVDALGADGFIDDVCQPSFDTTLDAIAALLDPGQTVPLQGTPPDWRLLQASVRRAGGALQSCAVGLPGDAPGLSQAIYREPQAGRGASLTFQGSCLLGRGDTVEIQLLCAG